MNSLYQTFRSEINSNSTMKNIFIKNGSLSPNYSLNGRSYLDCDSIFSDENWGSSIDLRDIAQYAFFLNRDRAAGVNLARSLPAENFMAKDLIILAKSLSKLYKSNAGRNSAEKTEKSIERRLKYFNSINTEEDLNESSTFKIIESLLSKYSGTDDYNLVRSFAFNRYNRLLMLYSRIKEGSELSNEDKSLLKSPKSILDVNLPGVT